MISVSFDERSLIASLASFLSEVNPGEMLENDYHNNQNKSDIAKLTRTFFENKIKYPFISYVEKMFKDGANPYVIHDCTLALSKDMSEWESKPLFMKYTPKEVNYPILNFFPNMIRDFYLDNSIQEYIKIVENDIKKTLNIFKENINYLESKNKLFSRLEKLDGIRGKNIIIIPEPLEIPHVGFHISNDKNIYIILGSDFSIYYHKIKSLNTADYIEQVGVIIHELFHSVVGFEIQNDNSCFLDEIKERVKLENNTLKVYKNAPLLNQADEIITEALTISYIKLIFDYEMFQEEVKHARDMGFDLSIEIADICAKHFGL